MISERIHSNQEVAAFMSLARMNMLARGNKFELLLRSGRMDRIPFGINELKRRDPESRTANIPEIAFYEALLNTFRLKVSLDEACAVMGRTLDRILNSALGRSSFIVNISASFLAESPAINITIVGGQPVSVGNDEVRRQAMNICMVSAREDLSAKIKVASPMLEIDVEADDEIKMMHGESVSKYRKGQEVIAICGVNHRRVIEELARVLNVTEGMEMNYRIFISVGFVTPLVGMTEYNRTLFDGTVVELTQEELDKNAEEYQRDAELIDPLGDDFLAIGGEYPWKFALGFMSEGAFYGYEWERKGSIFQDKRYKHPVGRLKIKGGATHKFILHWDGESYRIEITDMEPDSDLGKEMISYGLSFETTPKNTKKKK